MISEFVFVLNTASRYSADIIGKGLQFSIILELLFYVFLSLFGIGLIYGIFIASILTFKYISSNQLFKFKFSLTNGLIVVLGTSLALFEYNNWILPKVYLEMSCLFWDIKSTPPGSNLRRSDESLFKDIYSNLTISGISLKLDSVKSSIAVEQQKCSELLKSLPDSIARNTYNSNNLQEYGIEFYSSGTKILSLNEKHEIEVQFWSFKCQLRRLFEDKGKYLHEITYRIVLPVQLIIFYILGASFGFLFNDKKKILVIFAGLFSICFYYFIFNGFEKLIKQDVLSNAVGTISYLIILLFTSLIFLILSIKKEKNYPT